MVAIILSLSPAVITSLSMLSVSMHSRASLPFTFSKSTARSTGRSWSQWVTLQKCLSLSNASLGISGLVT
uniref:Putative secreted protein n=1 Tax=Ixodes ricinus TaxID=34613 RepID=A0A6B0TRI3_IXORI